VSLADFQINIHFKILFYFNRLNSMQNENIMNLLILETGKFK